MLTNTSVAIRSHFSGIKLRNKFVRLVGFAIAVASLLPIYEFSKAGIDYIKRNHIRSVTIDYASALSEDGQHERATKILSKLDDAADYDANTQFHIALITARARLYTNGQFQNVEDSVNLLIRIVESDPLDWFSTWNVSDLIELRLLLNEVRIQRQKYKDVIGEINLIGANYPKNAFSNKLSQLMKLQEGISLVHTHQRESGERILLGLLSSNLGNVEITARAKHAYGSSKLVNGELDEAESHLLSALDDFAKIDDEFRQVRTLANLAIVPVARRDYDTARFYWVQQEAISRRIGDSVGLNNALLGLSNAARIKRNFDVALSYAEDAKRMAEKDQSAKLLASAWQTIANIQYRAGEYSLAFEAAKNSIPLFTAEGDIRGMRSALGILGQVAVELGDAETAIFGLSGAVSCIDAVLTEENLSQKRDRSLYLSSLRRIASELGDEDLSLIIGRTNRLLSSIHLTCPKTFEILEVIK